MKPQETDVQVVMEDPESLGKSTTVTDLAVKADDAEVPVWLWNKQVLRPWAGKFCSYCESVVVKGLDAMRKVLFTYWLNTKKFCQLV